MKFEWDEEKNEKNWLSHGIRFDEAKTVWADVNALEFFDEHHTLLEKRYLRIGYSSKLRILLVVFCERREGDSIRIISARKATRAERKNYEERV